jgi:hypothetical protein
MNSNLPLRAMEVPRHHAGNESGVANSPSLLNSKKREAIIIPKSRPRNGPLRLILAASEPDQQPEASGSGDLRFL